jgi:hypothetical protein
MSRRGSLLICVVLLAAAGVGAAVVALVDPSGSASASSTPEVVLTDPPMKSLRADQGRVALRSPERAAAKKGKSKKPSIKDLITSDPVAVAASGTTVVSLSCGKSQGIALDGGVITPAPPSQVVVTTLSRRNPNPPFDSSKRNYYVGVRNLDAINASTFRGTLVCAKGIGIR